MKLPIINEKEIVPIRLIPIITARNIGRQELAGILAHRLGSDGFPLEPEYIQVDEADDGESTIVSRAELFGPSSRDFEIYAYHLNGHSKPVRMLSTEWDEICREIAVLEPLLRKEEKIIGVPDSKESVWLLESMKALPPGVFLWREDLDNLWHARVDHRLSLDGEREDSRKMNYDAYVMPKYRDLVLEGFEEIMNTKTPADNAKQELKLNTKINESLLKMIIAMAIVGYKYNSHANKNKAISEIMEDVEKVGLTLSENTIRKYLNEASELLPRNNDRNSQ